MSLTKLTQEVNNISTLSDYPNSTEGLTSQDLKERFDKASVDIKDYINSTLTDELDTIHANFEETLATKEEVDLDYLKKTDAEATYETIENVDAYKDEVDETYLKKDDAGEIYLSKEDASIDYLTKNEASTTYDTISNVANIYATKQALAEAQMGAIVDQSVTKEKLSLDVQATLDNAETNIDDLVTSVASINGKIPSEASTTNQLADKDYVDGRVQENTANFIGRFDSVAELEAYAGTLTNNDYAYVVTQEVGGNEKIVRYRYVANTTSWEEEFDMNNTIFTQSQLDTINSGLGASDTGKYVNKYNVPSVEKVETIVPTPFATSNCMYNSTTTSIVKNNIVNKIDILNTTIGKNIVPELTILGSKDILFNITDNTSYSTFYTAISSRENISEQSLKTILTGTSYNTYNRIGMYTSNNRKFDYIYDFKTQVSATLKMYVFWVSSSTNNSTRIYGSNDNITYTLIRENIPQSSNVQIPIENYRYVKITFDNATRQELYYMYFDNITGIENLIEYQNQFTLDNNGNTFVNNQRVLIEPPINVEEVETTLVKNILPTDISPFWDYGETRHSLDTNLISGRLTQFSIVEPTYEWITTSQSGFYTHATTNTYAGFTTINTQNTQGFGLSSGAFTLNEQRTTPDSQNQNVFACYGNEETSIYKIYDMKIECKPTFSYYFSSIEGMSKKCIEASNDNINWVELTSLNTTQSTFAPQDYYRYYRFRFDNNSYGNFEMRYCYISQVIYKETKEVPYDVVSNTINEVPCDTLLQPRKKYELIYNENTDKFELGKLSDKTLFDITLTEAVNRVDLTGICNMLEYGKTYCLIINGYANNPDIIVFGDAGIAYTNSSNSSFENTTPFIFRKYLRSNKVAICGLGYNDNLSTTGAFSFKYSTLEGYEYIKASNNSYTLNIGTRIIIKEVA